MKTPKGVRTREADELHKAKRLEPIRKSGKERHTLYNRVDDEDDQPSIYPKRESVLDYLDDDE